MTDELQQASSQQKVSHEPQVFVPLPKPPKLKKSIRGIFGVAVGVLCLGSIACLAILGILMNKVNTEKAPIELVVNDFMRYMADRDVESAYTLFSPRAQQQIPRSKIQEMLEGNNYLLFEGYQSLSVSNISISFVVNTNPDVPQGTVAKVTGIINFEGGIQGSFDGTLEEVDGTWMIDGIYVTVPPDKIK